MESYVVRVYRRDAKDSEKLAGLVELVEVDEEKAFTSFDELRAILNSTPGQTDRSKKRKERASAG
jgi:hypothetical protein